jgi:hypothetical protein
MSTTLPLALAATLLIGTATWPERASAWRQDVDDPVDDSTYAQAIAVDPAGDVVAAGVLKPTGFSGGEFGVIKFAGATGTQLWRRSIFGIAPGSGNGANAVTTDAAGDVVATGFTQNGATDEDFTVVKLASANGMEVWRQTLSLSSGNDVGNDVATDGAGDVIAVGSQTFVGGDFTVVKLAGGTGAELWRQDTNDGFAFALALYPGGDVIAAGRDGAGFAFAVTRLTGATGAEAWRTVLDDSGFASDVAIDGAGDVLAAGTVDSGSGVRDLFVVKLSGGTGTELWRRSFSGTDPSFQTMAEAVAVDAAGDVFVAGHLTNRNTEDDWLVVKLAGATGADLWSREVSGTAGFSFDRATSLALDSAGDAIVAGFVDSGSTNHDFTVLRLAGASGAELWRQSIDGSDSGDGSADTDEALAVAVTAADYVVAAGFTQNERSSIDDTRDFAVVRLDGIDGGVGPVLGRRLVVADKAADPSARRISVTATDRAIKTPPSESAGDPTLGGGSITLMNPTTLESATLPLPSGSWRGLGTPAGSRGYKYGDPGGANGPCKAVLAKPGKLRASCLGGLGPIPFSLDEPTQGALVLSLQLGAASAQCVRFGGDVRRDAGTANPGPSGTFIATHAPVFSGDCP